MSNVDCYCLIDQAMCFTTGTFQKWIHEEDLKFWLKSLTIWAACATGYAKAMRNKL